MISFVRLVLLVIAESSLILCLDNGLAITPPMGWLSWERYRCITDCKTYPDSCISENLYTTMADWLVKDGYRDAGYVYVNVDDCWASKERDNKTKRLVPDPDRFPHGIKWLADYMHEKGLKLGIYNDFGTLTCGGYPGSIEYLQLDAQTFADWGIDSVKMDGCYSNPSTMDLGYPKFGKYLNETGRPMLFSCSWPAYQTGNPKYLVNYTNIAKYCNLWRNWGDIQDSFDDVVNILDYYGDNKGGFLDVAGPGHFNDPDMIIIGDFSLSYDEQRVQMAMWAMLAAPLYMSNDLRNIRPESKALLLNKHLLAISQDKLGKSAKRIYKLNSNHVSVWKKQLIGGAWAVASVNTAYFQGTPYEYTDTLEHMGITKSTVYLATCGFTGKLVGVYKTNEDIKFSVVPNGVQLILFSPAIDFSY